MTVMFVLFSFVSVFSDNSPTVGKMLQEDLEMTKITPWSQEACNSATGAKYTLVIDKPVNSNIPVGIPISAWGQDKLPRRINTQH